jgi:integrase/recombinase XerC
MTLSNYFVQYLDWMRAGGASDHTLTAYRRALAKLGEALGAEAPPEALNAFSLQNFIGYLRLAGLADSSISQALAAAKSFVAWATEEGIYADTFAPAVRGPRRPARIPEVPAIDAMQHMLDGEAVFSSWPERDRLVLELLYGSGLRNSELIGLNLDDRVKRDEFIIRGKGKKERKVPISELARIALTDYLPVREKVLSVHRKETAALILNLRGGRITTRSIGRIVKHVAQAKGLPSGIHPHSLRHACAGHMLGNGAHLADVQKLLGHAHLATTLLYSGGTNWKRMRETYDRTFKR